MTSTWQRGILPFVRASSEDVVWHEKQCQWPEPSGHHVEEYENNNTFFQKYLATDQQFHERPIEVLLIFWLKGESLLYSEVPRPEVPEDLFPY